MFFLWLANRGPFSFPSHSVGKNSTAAKAVNAVPEKSISEKFSELPTGAKAAVYACSAAAAAGLVGYAAFYCFRQRKQGMQEAAKAAQMAEEERVELERYKAAGVNPDGFSDVAPTPNEKFGASAASRPLLNDNGAGSPPGTPHGQGQNPYSDGFSPIDNSGYGSPSMPPSGPLPGTPGAGGYGNIDGVANSGAGSNPNGGHAGFR